MIHLCQIITLSRNHQFDCVLGFAVPTFFQLVLGGLTMFNFLRKEKISMSKTITKAVGAGAVGPSESSQLRWLV